MHKNLTIDDRLARPAQALRFGVLKILHDDDEVGLRLEPAVLDDHEVVLVGDDVLMPWKSALGY